MKFSDFSAAMNEHKDANFAITGLKGKMMEAVIADNLVKLSLVEQPKKMIETVANVLVVLGKLDAAAAANLEVVANGKVIMSAEFNGEDYMVCKIS